MRWKIGDAEIASNFTGATLSLTWEDRAECFEGVDYFKYLGQILNQADKDWPTVLHNIRRVRKFWGRLAKLLIREGTDPIISEKFYRAVVQAGILFGLETWMLKAVMLQYFEGIYVGFLRRVTEMKYRKLGDKTWLKEGEYRVLQETGKKIFVNTSTRGRQH